jgi:nucleotide-binding universal stress UspA family protein
MESQTRMITFEHILIPLDGSPLSEEALPVAISLAQKYDSQLILFRTLDLSPSVMESITHPAAQALFDQWKEQATAAVERYLSNYQEKLREQGVQARTVVHEQPAAEAILDTATAEQIDLIVMTTHGRGGAARWACGSVADKVARHAPCPVLLVRQNPTAPHEESAE